MDKDYRVQHLDSLYARDALLLWIEHDNRAHAEVHRKAPCIAECA